MTSLGRTTPSELPNFRILSGTMNSPSYYNCNNSQEENARPHGCAFGFTEALLWKISPLPLRLLRYQLLPCHFQLGTLVADGDFGQLPEVAAGCGRISGGLRCPRRAVQGVKAVRGDLQHGLIFHQRLLGL